MRIAVLFILGIFITTNSGAKNHSYDNILERMLVDTCYDALSIDSFLDCPELDGCVSGKFSDFDQGLFDWGKLTHNWQWIEPNIDTNQGAWFHFTAISNAIDIVNCINEDIGVLMINNFECDSHQVILSQELPIISNFGSSGHLATRPGKEYFVYIYIRGSSQDSFSICIDNDQRCSDTITAYEYFCDALPICQLSDIDGRCLRMRELINHLTRINCQTGGYTINNPHWIVFAAGEDSVSISMTIDRCDDNYGLGVQIEAYQINWSDTISDSDQCPYELLSAPLLECHYSYIIAPIPPGDSVILGFSTERGGVYGLLIDGWTGSICDISMYVNYGGALAQLDTFTPPKPIWNDDLFPFVGDTLCTGTNNVVFHAPARNGIINYRWLVNDSVVNYGVASSEIWLNFLNEGTYSICTQKISPCSESEVSCIEVVVKDFISQTFHIDTIIQCNDSLKIDARDFESFEYIVGVNFTLPNGYVINTDSFTIINRGKYVVSANECSDSVIINVLRPFEIDDTISQQDCYYTSIIVNTVGIDNPEYTWSNGDTTSAVDSLTFGWHHVTISSTNYDCDFHRSYFVDFPDSCNATILGKISIVDTTTCGSTLQSYPVQNQKVQVNPIGLIVPTDVLGNYSVELPPGVYQVMPILNTSAVGACPSTQLDTIKTTSDTIFSNFDILDTNACILTSMISSGPARPGRFVRFSIFIRNEGITSRDFRLYGDLDDHYRFNTFETLNYHPPGWTGNRYYWQINNLAPGSEVHIVFRIQLKVSAQNANTLSNLFTSDDCLSDRNYGQLVRNSYDPNDKTLHTNETRATEQILKSDSMLNYVVRFQNTGNDTAFFVQITDQLSDHFDIKTFNPGPTSHDYNWRIVPPRTVEFTFDPIYLPYQLIDDEGSQGFVSFEIKTSDEFMLNDSVQNNAAIFFDFNDPIITNTTNSRFERPQYIQEYSFELCEGDTFMSAALYADTVFESTVEYFDFDSVYRTHVQVIQDMTEEIDTIVDVGTNIFGIIAANDTVLSVTLTSLVSGCDSIVQYNIIVLSGTEDPYRELVSISPNPFSDQIYLTSQSNISRVKVYDSSGKLVLFQDNIRSTGVSISTESIDVGFYILVVSLSEKDRHFKILKH